MYEVVVINVVFRVLNFPRLKKNLYINNSQISNRIEKDEIGFIVCTYMFYLEFKRIIKLFYKKKFIRSDISIPELPRYILKCYQKCNYYMI